MYVSANILEAEICMYTRRRVIEEVKLQTIRSGDHDHDVMTSILVDLEVRHLLQSSVKIEYMNHVSELKII